MSRGTLACLLGRSFPFPSLIGIFPSFCQALAEDRVTTPTKKKKKGIFKTQRVFAPSSSEFIPFLTCHHSITDFEINAFLNQDSYRLLKFVSSDLVSIFDTG